MSCYQLGGACDQKFATETFDEIPIKRDEYSLRFLKLGSAFNPTLPWLPIPGAKMINLLALPF